MTVAEAVAAAVERLRAGGLPEPVRDARWLVALAGGYDVGRLTLLAQEGFEAEAALEALLLKRLNRQPVSQIRGWREFWGRRFRVTPDVLDPRPETETLIEAALSEHFESVLDLGVGSGCILLTLMAERPGVSGTGTDVSEAALAVTRSTADAFGLHPTLGISDWFVDLEGQWDLIVSNPPYIAEADLATLAPELSWEPREALSPGGDGLGAYRRIAAGAAKHLRPGGRLLLEIGLGQARDVIDLLATGGLSDISVLSDLDGRDRVVQALYAPHLKK